MRLLLLRPPELWTRPGVLGHPPTHSSIYPPLGLLYVAAMLEQQDHQVEIIDLGAETISQDDLEKSLSKSDAVGMSVYRNNYQLVAELAKKVKEYDHTLSIVLGGPQCTFLREKIFEDIPHADIAVDLEGEHVIIDLIEFYTGKKKLEEIPGICFRENNQIKKGNAPRIIENLDMLPFPARHLVEKYDYGNFPWGFQAKKKFTTMLTSRGCPFRCRFCARYIKIYKEYYFRQRSAENVVQELQEIDRPYGSVTIVDDNFLVDTKRAHKIFDLLIDSKTKIELLIQGARVDSAEIKLYQKMKQANVKFLGFGIESGSQTILDYYNKKVTLDQIRNAVQLSRKMNFFTCGNFIFGAPIETKQQIKETIKFARSLPFDLVIFLPLRYEIGSDLWNEAVEQGKINENEYLVLADSKRGLGNITYDELEQYAQKASKEFFLRPTYFISQLYRTCSNRDINRLKNIWRVTTKYPWKEII